ncbi:Uncharacterized protein OBRU01_08744 [Operophtera brumata]|uniref:Tyr recombinase domain-containing protein n=1 Tax=Operophtera brumata TaxID=104452 RepID=A0A0L7LAF5_OPEBR|nr:Uncharacterized protein OBRU01_08744 [Operophtera brumata]
MARIETTIKDMPIETDLLDDSLVAADKSHDETLLDTLPTENPSPLEAEPEVLTENISELDLEIRLALGDPAEEIPTYAENIHTDIAKRWLPILCKGLTKEGKEKILKEHTAVTEIVRARDKKLEAKQGQLGLGISAISKAMSMLLGDGKKVEVIKLLSEGCRILSDLHFTETQTRSKLITPCLDKSFLNIIQDEERDDTLFGRKLSEKISSAKVIEKQETNCTVISCDKVQYLTINSNKTAGGKLDSAFSVPHVGEQGGRGAYTASRPAPSTIYRRNRTQAPLPPPPSTPTAPQHRQAASRQQAPITAVIMFLTKKFQKGASFGSLNSHRSALSLLLVLDHVCDWYPNDSLPLDQITKKLAMLLALWTGHRVQTLSVIKLGNVVFSRSQIIITISDLIKTSAAGRKQPTLMLPYFNISNICPAKCLVDYLSVTRSVRNGIHHLFITHKRPHKRATAQTISRWLKDVLAASGIDVVMFSAHNTRTPLRKALAQLVFLSMPFERQLVGPRTRKPLQSSISAQ